MAVGVVVGVAAGEPAIAAFVALHAWSVGGAIGLALVAIDVGLLGVACVVRWRAAHAR